MQLSAQISVYPLRQDNLSPAIDAVVGVLEEHGFNPEVGAMSTLVCGNAEALFEALREAFDRAARLGPVVMTITVSNACPL